MATDVQIVFPVDQVPLTQVMQVPGLVPRTLNIIGLDFRAVEQVLLNNVISPSVVVLNPQSLLAQVPPVIAGDTITSVSVLSTTLTLTAKSLMRFQIGTRSQKVNGLLRLIQLFLKILFTTPGKDIFSPNLGGAALKNLGGSFTGADGKGLIADFYVAVDQTVKQITSLQARQTQLPRSEKLLSASVIGANFNAQETSLIASVNLLSQTGQSALANLLL